jgi:glycerol uptake facilitator-like aquaporin
MKSAALLLPLRRREACLSAFPTLLAEWLGTAFLLATVVGSGIMAERLAGGNTAIALLCNTLPTRAILFVLITMLAPVSGAHFNPAVTGVFLLNRDLPAQEAAPIIAAQCADTLVGTMAAHLMFEEPVWQLSEKLRDGPAQWLSEWVATFGLVTAILLTKQANPRAMAAVVGLYITAAYWFTASTSLANPAVTLARAFSDTFAGIRLVDVPAFAAAQFLGAVCALYVIRTITGTTRDRAETQAVSTNHAEGHF